jgi:predicted PurR-regulated permease PerM
MDARTDVSTPPAKEGVAGTHARGLADALRGRSTLQSMLFTAVAVGLLLFLIQWAQPVLAPLLLGLFLTALTAPVFGWALGKGAPPWAALLATVGGVLAIGFVIVLIAFASANQLLASLDLYTDQVLARYPELASVIAAIGLTISVETLIPAEAIPSLLGTTASIVIDIASTLGIAIVIAALLLLDGRRLATLIGRGLGSDNPVVREVPGVARAAVTYFGVRIRINAVTAIGLLVLMLVLGVDDALLWGIATFFLSFVPYLGLTLALIPPALLAFAESGLAAAAILVVGGAVLNVIAENILEPAWAGRALSLATWLVFVMFFAAVWLLGPVGMLVSMPITVLIVLLLQGDERSRWIASLLTRETGGSPDAST